MASRKPRPGFDIQVDGCEELTEAFDNLKRRVQSKILMPALERGARIVHASARQKVRVRTGRLRDTMMVLRGRFRRGAIGWVVRTASRRALGIDADDPYYYPTVLEYGGVVGWRKQKTALGFLGKIGGAVRRSDLRAAQRSAARKRGNRQIAAHPYMRPAVDENYMKIVGIIKQALAKGIREEIVKQKRKAERAARRAARLAKKGG